MGASIFPSGSGAGSKVWGLIVAGYSAAAVALVAVLTFNGASGVPAAAIVGAGGLVLIGLLLPIAGMLQLRRGLAPAERYARWGFSFQVFGLLLLLFGVALVVVVSSLLGYFLSFVIIAVGAASAVAGAFLLRRHFLFMAANPRSVAYLMIATVMVFSGVELISGSNIAFQYWISQLENTIYVDVGATVSACGCVIAAYSYYTLFKRK